MSYTTELTMGPYTSKTITKSGHTIIRSSTHGILAILKPGIHVTLTNGNKTFVCTITDKAKRD